MSDVAAPLKIRRKQCDDLFRLVWAGGFARVKKIAGLAAPVWSGKVPRFQQRAYYR